MDIDEIEEALTGQDVTGTDVAVAVALLLVGGLLYVVVGRLARRGAARLPENVLPGEAVDVLIRFTQLLVLGIFVAWALTVLGASAGWLTLLVVTLLLIGLIAARPFVDGLTSSVAVATRSAFSVGDEIAVEGAVGRVEQVTQRSTVIRTRDGLRVHVPNAELMAMTVTVLTAYDERRSSVDLTVSFATDLDQADEVIRAALVEVDPITRMGSIRARSLAEGVVLSVRFWHGPTSVEANEALDGAVRAIKVAFEHAGIDFAPGSSVLIADRGNDQR